MPRPASVLVPALFAFLTAPLAAQKRALTEEDYDSWRSLRDTAVSQDGRFVAYSLVPQQGDAELVVVSSNGRKRFRYPRGRRPRFTADGKFLCFEVSESFATQRAAKLAKLEAPSKGKRASSRPKKALGILRLADVGRLRNATPRVRLVKKLSSFQVPEVGPALVVYKLASDREPAKAPEGEAAGARAPRRRRGPPQGRAARGASSSRGTLVVRDLDAGRERRFANVSAFGLGKKRALLWFVREEIKKAAPKKAAPRKGEPREDAEKKPEQKDAAEPASPPAGPPGLFVLALDRSVEPRALFAGSAEFKNQRFDREETRFAFLQRSAAPKSARGKSARSAAAKKKPPRPWNLWCWRTSAQLARRLVAAQTEAGKTAGLPQGEAPTPDRPLAFSRDGSRLLFGVKEIEKPETPKLLDEDKVTLDLWHWQDPLLQPMQAKRASAERKRSDAWVIATSGGQPRKLADRGLDAIAFAGTSGKRVLAQDGRPYAKLMSWDARYRDFYAIDTKTGKKRKLLSKQRGRTSVSTTGRYVAWFGEDARWNCVDTSRGSITTLTGLSEFAFADERDDHPAPARAYGVAGWASDDSFVLLYDRYDLWRAVPGGRSLVRLTAGFGRRAKLRLRRVVTDPDEVGIDPDKPLLLQAFDEETMASGYYRLPKVARGTPQKLVMLDEAFGRRLTKAKRAPRFFFTRSTFARYPDLWTATESFTGMRRLSTANPQQAEVRWGSAELVSWRSTEGVPLEGVLAKPEGFDPRKKYPLLVHIYERRSEGLHRYSSPGPGTSPNASYYVSNGYLWFTPDIVYRVGHPGASSLACVVPGVLSLVEKGFVDRERIGIAGHSWGGYETAYLVAHTDLFAAAESGAPVSNMTSAYGGIRWGSGMSRMFQYEKTQSRIGRTLWERPMLYLENSPLFAAEKVRTPLLMLHNDKDGAVPWYQGIELFVALRRLGREAYLFNYNGEQHGLRKRANQRDWTRRMAQFFDHHLKGTTAPDWMQKGVPYVEREREKLRWLSPAQRAEIAQREAKAGEAKPAEPPAKGGGN